MRKSMLNVLAITTASLALFTMASPSQATDFTDHKAIYKANVFQHDQAGHLVAFGIPMGVPLSAELVTAPKCSKTPWEATAPCRVEADDDHAGKVDVDLFGVPKVIDHRGHRIYNDPMIETQNGVVVGVGATVYVDGAWAFRTALIEQFGQPVVNAETGEEVWAGAADGYTLRLQHNESMWPTVLWVSKGKQF
ncbi:hypothetical protein SAMN05216466_106107 [Paraburkholderia phenazinium]|uniref:Uncharacterized protein n=1 Tax=Paraburkholderia phenazinium TaxID=60549 RepID=A0A1G7YBV1_9BURK|nr:hypothetical protein [Paraburkholderia phenazinium]SDG93470.1 hypothetical protein SAMN05216466_106107 [Paraburkholderia phenazinium]